MKIPKKGRATPLSGMQPVSNIANTNADIKHYKGERLHVKYHNMHMDVNQSRYDSILILNVENIHLSKATGRLEVVKPGNILSAFQHTNDTIVYTTH